MAIPSEAKKGFWLALGVAVAVYLATKLGEKLP